MSSTPTPPAKRLAPKGDTLRELFLKSGNLCAFPNCQSLMMDSDGDFVGQVCHIEAAEEGGERFNDLQSNEDRRAASNLMLMCYSHHIKTNDVDAYPVAKLKAMKADHERRFAHPDRAMLAKIMDSTDADIPTVPQSLMRFVRVNGWDLSEDELKEPIEEFAGYIAKFRNAPVETRRMLAAIAMRANKMKGQQAAKISDGQVRLLIDDALSALSTDEDALSRGIRSITSCGLGDIDEIDTYDFGPQTAVRLVQIAEGIGWDDIVSFCRTETIDISVFSEELEFGRLDE